MTTTTATPEKLPPLRDPTAFVKAMSRVASALAVDLVARAKDARVEPSLLESYADEKAAGRTGEDFITWRNAFCDQVAASWVLCTVFVRTLEDRGFLRHRVAGPGAADRLAQFQRMFRFLSERDYLRQVFDALAEPPPSWPRDRPADDWVGAQVFGRSSAPLWRLSPSAGALSAMLDALRAVDAEGTLLFTFGRPEGVEHDGSTTRFLGDLYQDLNEGVRKRYALLQTPDFVERFILDQTLTPALHERGIAVTVCDPTCGSGHFLLGAYDRLFEARTRQEPGRSVAERARQALSQVYGIDLNPYAAAIARFRLVLSMMDKAGLTALDQVPHDLMTHIYVDDALLSGKVGVARLGEGRVARQQFEFGDIAGLKDTGFQEGLGFSFLDPRADALLKSTRFDVVVGNPPYITEKDPIKREKIRAAYPKSAAGKFALSAPFVERVFNLANEGGWTGQITSNSFMKREFGKTLIEAFLPTVDLFEVVDTSGAYIPGHGTPTVMLFGRHRQPVAGTLQMVRGTRGEPSTPADPAQGRVWGAIAEHHGDTSFEDTFLSVGRIERAKLGEHPWSLGGGGAAELVEHIQSRAKTCLADLADSIGISSFTLEDDVYLSTVSSHRRYGLNNSDIKTMVEGDIVRDWSLGNMSSCVTPYDEHWIPAATARQLKYLWPWRTQLGRSILFGGKTKIEGGLKWWEFGRLTANKLRTPLSIVFAEVSTHNHFVLDFGGKIFKQTAPIIKLPPDFTIEQHSALVGYLNSSCAAFFLKQICYPKGVHTEDRPEAGRPEMNRYAFGSTAVGRMPVPPRILDDTLLLQLTREMGRITTEYEAAEPQHVLRLWMLSPGGTLESAFEAGFLNRIRLRQKQIAIQEEIDWTVYALLSLVDDQAGSGCVHSEGVELTDLPYNWIEKSEAPQSLPSPLRERYQRRRLLLENSRQLSLLENAVCKRQWKGTRGSFGHEGRTDAQLAREACETTLADLIELELSGRADARAASIRGLVGAIGGDARVAELARVAAGGQSTDVEAVVARLIESSSVPGAPALIYTESGAEKRRLWEATWELQRREDLGTLKGVVIGSPPRYVREDYQHSATVWESRAGSGSTGLDVPKERFILYPTATPPPGAAGAIGLFVGWSGWTHLQQLQAAIALWQDEWAEHGNKLVPRATRDALDAADPAAVADRAMREKLLPILQTMVDLLPWVRQWHNDDGETADQFDSYVEEQCRLLEMSRDDVHLWRMPAKVKGPKKKATKKKATARATAAPAVAPIEDEGDVDDG